MQCTIEKSVTSSPIYNIHIATSPTVIFNGWKCLECEWSTYIFASFKWYKILLILWPQRLWFTLASHVGTVFCCGCAVTGLSESELETGTSIRSPPPPSFAPQMNEIYDRFGAGQKKNCFTSPEPVWVAFSRFMLGVFLSTRMQSLGHSCCISMIFRNIIAFY